MTPSLLAAPINHLLAQSSWARDRLRGHAGQAFGVYGGPLRLRLQVDSDGYFTGATGEDDVQIRLPADAPARLLFGRESIFAEATLQGRADFSETLGFVFRNLRWDAEADLARVTGDVIAVRLMRVLSAFFQWQSESAKRLVSNFGEYALEEKHLLPRNPEMAVFSRGVNDATRDLDALQARLTRLRP